MNILLFITAILCILPIICLLYGIFNEYPNLVIIGVIGIFITFISSMFIQAYQLRLLRKESNSLLDNEYNPINTIESEKDSTGAPKNDDSIIQIITKEHILKVNQ